MSEDRGNKTIWDWMRLQWAPDYTQIRVLGVALGLATMALAMLAALVAFGLLVTFAIAVYAAVAAGTGVTGEAIRNIGLALAAAFGAPFVAWRAMIAHRQTQVSERGLASDRFRKANELLGSENESLRIAPLHILAELACTRQADLDAATGVIVNRVRQLSSYPPVDFDDSIPEVRPDVASRATEDLSSAETHHRDEAIKAWIASIPSPVQELKVALDLLGQIPRSKTRRLVTRI